MSDDVGCHGPCQQGRKECPHPQACYRPEDGSKPQVSSLLIAIMLVLVIFIALWVLS